MPSASQVLVWTQLAGGDSAYCAILVATNSVLQMVLFAPMAVFFIRVIGHDTSGVSISYSVVAVSVEIFLGIPLGAAIVTRVALHAVDSPEWYGRHFLQFASHTICWTPSLCCLPHKATQLFTRSSVPCAL